MAGISNVTGVTDRDTPKGVCHACHGIPCTFCRASPVTMSRHVTHVTVRKRVQTCSGWKAARQWRWRQWRAYRKAEAELDLESRTRRDWWKHCRDATDTGALKVGPGLRE